MRKNTFTKLINPYAKKGLWVALSSDRKKVVGKGKTVEEALREAEKKNIKNPALIKAAPIGSGFIGFFGNEI